MKFLKKLEQNTRHAAERLGNSVRFNSLRDEIHNSVVGIETQAREINRLSNISEVSHLTEASLEKLRSTNEMAQGLLHNVHTQEAIVRNAHNDATIIENAAKTIQETMIPQMQSLFITAKNIIEITTAAHVQSTQPTQTDPEVHAAALTQITVLEQQLKALQTQVSPTLNQRAQTPPPITMQFDATDSTAAESNTASPVALEEGSQARSSNEDGFEHIEIEDMPETGKCKV